MGTRGIETTSSAQVEIISAYSAPQQSFVAVAVTPGWFVAGAFFMPASVDETRLEMIGAVSDASLKMRARLFDLVANEPVDGSIAQLATTTDSRTTSGLVELTGGRSYQIQVEVTGAAGDGLFGILKSATLIP